MKTLVVFREGQNGNFLKLLIENYKHANVDFRISDIHPTNHFDITLTHNVDFILQKEKYDQVIRILPEKKIYLAIYNNFIKKLVREQAVLDFSNWKSHTTAWYDTCFYNIEEYYNLICSDICNNQYTDVISFDLMLDPGYMNTVLNQYFGVKLDQSRLLLLESYSNLQLKIPIDSEAVLMQDISDVISDDMFENNPWFFSYCLHKFEKANNFTEKNRKWSIDSLPGILTRQTLTDISVMY
jgi:hypothetical protein